jgi:2-polyprenyl-3-methyl-5-hydroxy-6-metoxy-1,4-benzoquinol methylase
VALNLGMMHFYWRLTDNAQPGNPVPTTLPFSFEIDETLGLLKQTRSPEVEKALKAVYQHEANVGYLEEGNDLALLYGQDFVLWASKYLSTRLDRELLEIGCGRGYLLNEYYNLGIRNLSGIDPNPGSVESLRSKVNFIKGFFPDDMTKGRYDIIMHYDVLEHIFEPVVFLKKHLEHLNEGGIVLVAVPDCSKAIELGDVSMAIHEHVNFFNEASLQSVFTKAGFKVLEIKQSSSVGTIYVAAQRCMSDEMNEVVIDKDLHCFFERANSNIKNFKETFDNAIQSGSIGMYVPLRFFPYLAASSSMLPPNVRFFDDSSAFKGKYYDGFTNQIEGGESMKERPVGTLFVGSFVFSEKIKAKVKQFNGAQSVIGLNEICSKGSEC